MNAVKQGNATLESYAYNHRGERVLRKPAGGAAQITLYDEAGQWLGNYSATGQVQQQAIWLDNHPVALINAPSTGVPELAYVQPDHLGTPRVVIDPVHDVAIWEWSNKSEVFGDQIPSADPDGDGVAFDLALRFPGQQSTDASGLFYNYQREYDPAVGRYSRSDPIGLSGGINSYLYSSAMPAGRTDPLGLRDYSACETNEELTYARRSALNPLGVTMVFLNSTTILDYRAKNDGRIGKDRDTFLVDGNRLSAESFGNYVAGYGAAYLWGPVGWGVTSLAGMVYDIEDVFQGRPYNWDMDSRADIDAGAIRAMHEMLGNRPTGCGCGG